MKEVKIYTVDSFTTKRFYGNPAGVVPFADNLTVEEMQNIAKEINLSETAFILKSDQADFKIKYFSPTQEIDFCGHATIALAWVLGKMYDYTKKVHRLMLETNVGMIPVDWVLDGETLKSVIMTQIEPQVKPFALDETLLKMIGLNEHDLDERYEVGLGYTGNWHLLIPVKNKEIINRVKPDYVNLGLHNKQHQLTTTHLFAFTNEEHLLYTRDFAPAVGVNEDPVTGSANGALTGYLILNHYLPQESQFTIVQTNSLKRDGELLIKTARHNEKIQIQVGGAAVIIINGVIRL